MRTSRKLTHVLTAIFAIMAMTVAALAADPGVPVGNIPQGAGPNVAGDPHLTGNPVEIGSDMKAGSILAYTHYNSNSNNSSATDTRVNITNTHPTASVVVHFFFVSSSCSVADFKAELTQNQTYSFLTSDFDPDTSGYILAVAEDQVGLPIAWNYLIGDLYSKLANTFSINLGAIAYAARFDFNTQGNEANLAADTLTTSETTVINFGGVVGTGGSYDALGRSFAIDNIPSRAGGDVTRVIFAGIRGSYVTSALGSSSMFGVLYDDAEQGQSFSWSFACAEVKVLSNDTPRTAPRLDTVIPAGRTGWIRTYINTDGLTNSGHFGGGAMSMIVSNSAWGTAGGQSVNFHGAHNLQVLTRPTTAQPATLPVFPYELQTN